ncbi:antitoxin Xre/MbcA/ParS toxin-binding domain-containing protein [Luteolibacter algae]|uniref:Antitoxin Xre/MbcA/ParS toxin-binding domain-containing protein n=1 Tax=Luteolibacter algae TaxID=454151 RepID=A0ABW5D8E9_9BACT
MKYKAEHDDALKKGIGHPQNAESGCGIFNEPEAVYLVSRVRDGLDFDEFQTLRQMLELTEERLAALLGMSRATLHRRKKSGHLDRAESDRLVRYARLFARAVNVLGGNEAAGRWLREPAFAFHGECPLDYADTEIGAREVEALLGRIEHGVFS